VFLRRLQESTPTVTGRSIYSDWIRDLPREKDDIFDSIVRHWECSFAMVSVALDDALAMRAGGELVCAQEQVAVSASLMARLSASLASFCEYLARRGRHLRHIPAVEPLNPEFFVGNRAQSAATWNGLVHCVVFNHRARFVQKLRILSSTIDDLNREFTNAASEIAQRMHPSHWAALDAIHYDFNTCLRETEVILKCFVRATPMDQLAAFVGEAETPRSKRFRLRPSRVSA
jgi:hypothetical protein